MTKNLPYTLTIQWSDGISSVLNFTSARRAAEHMAILSGMAGVCSMSVTVNGGAV